MLQTRVIPCLLLKGRGLVKTVQFGRPKYLGDPINVVKIFNDKEVDELVLLDITATIEGRRPAFEYLAEIASECFMPLSYGGGVRTLEDVKSLLNLGIEKVVLNAVAVEDPSFIGAAADYAGSQSVVVSLDVKKMPLGRYRVFTRAGTRATGLDPADHAAAMERAGAGELLVNSIDRDGTMRGYDLDLVRRVSSGVRIPVVACGGAGSLEHLGQVVREGGASAAAAGSMFVFQGPLRAVLISYPSATDMRRVFSS